MNLQRHTNSTDSTKQKKHTHREEEATGTWSVGHIGGCSTITSIGDVLIILIALTAQVIEATGHKLGIFSERRGIFEPPSASK
jgi:hypothetical protein